jgi:hypothetical protein
VNDGFTRLKGLVSIVAGSLLLENMVIFADDNFVAGALEAAETRGEIQRRRHMAGGE